MDVMKLQASLGLDASEYEKGLRNAEGSVGGFGSRLKNAFGAAAKVGVAAVGAATTAIGVLVKQSVDSYAEYEQMVGGVKKLYGNMGLSIEDYAESVGKTVDEVRDEYGRLEEAQNLVIENAKNAWKTAGMSSNEYMEIATTFSASLINSLGGDTKKAAEMTDVAMRAISDNYNTFGGDLSMIQNAFQGFAKQNYMMLDNLKLGYGGTKSEMERLIADANEWAEANGKAAGLSIDSFADVVQAIEYIQEKQHIAGTTAKEASTTIAGSLQSLKAAWENLKTGFADPDADIGQLVKNVMTTAGTAVKNLIPAIMQAVKGIGEAMKTLLPQIMKELPKQLQQIGTPMIKAGMDLIVMLGKGLIQAAPQAFSAITGLVKSIADEVGKNAPTFMSKGLELLEKLSGGLREGAGKLVSAGLNLIWTLAKGFIDGLPSFFQHVPTIISNIAGIINDNVPKIIGMGIKIIGYLVVGLIKAIPSLIANLPKIIKAIVDVFFAVNWLSIGRSVIVAIGNGLKAAGGSIVSSLKGLGKRALEGFRNIKWGNLGRSVVNFIKNGIVKMATAIPSALFRLGAKAASKLANFKWRNLGINIIKGIARGIVGAASTIVTSLVNAAKRAYNAAKKYLGINSPSKLFRDKIGKGIVEGMTLGINENVPMVTKAMDDMNERLATRPIDVEPYSTENGEMTETETMVSVLNTPVGADDQTRVEERNTTVVLQLDRTQLAKTVFRLNNEEYQRVGIDLAGGYA